MAALTRFLGLAPSVRPLNVIALSSSATFSLSFIVFLNTIQPFFLTTYLDPPVPADVLGSVTGTIILGDEILTLVLVLVWGVVADRITVRRVASGGHLIIGLSFFLYPLARSPLPGVLLARLVFATGASALLTALGAAMAGMIAVPGSAPSPSVASRSGPPPRISVTRASTSNLVLPRSDDISERTSLLPNEEVVEDELDSAPQKASRYAGILGFSSGCGALLGVFGWFRLPGAFDGMSPKTALQTTFYIVGAVALAEGIFLSQGLKRRPVTITETLLEDDLEEEQDGGPKARAGWREKTWELIAELPKGVHLAREEPEIALAVLSSFTARAQTLVVTAFIPLYIDHYFLTHDCQSPCHRAVVLSASLTGTIQLISLLCAPLVGLLAPRISSPLTLAISSLIGVFSFLAFAFLPANNPSSWIVWVAGIGMGLSQIGGIVVGLALVAQGRAKVMKAAGTYANAKEIGGAISGVYSAAGGLGILIVGKLGGSLFDRWVGAPFALIASLDFLSSLFSLFVYMSEK